MLSGHVEYQILVVTRLAAFKSAKHKPEDAVQFLVSGALELGYPKGVQGPGRQTLLPSRVWGVGKRPGDPLGVAELIWVSSAESTA